MPVEEVEPRQYLSFEDRGLWLTERKKSVGASEAAAVMGVDPWRSAISVWADKSDGLIDTSTSDRAEWGLRKERVVGEKVADDLGLEIGSLKPMTIVRHKDYPWLHATPDFITSCDKNMQVKCVGKNAAKYWDEGPPIYVVIQCQQEMLVLGYTETILAVEIAGDPPIHYTLEFNEEFCEALKVATKQLMDCVVSGNAPEVEEQTSDSAIAAFRLLYPEDSGDTVQLEGDDWDSLLTVWEKAEADKKDADKTIQYIKAKFIRAFGEATYCFTPGGRKLSFKVQKRAGYTVEPTTVRTLRRLKK